MRVICHFKTPKGVVSIVQSQNRFRLYFEDEYLGSYNSPQHAVDDAAGGHTFTPSCGSDLGDLGVPDDLSDWTPGPYEA